MSIRVKKRSKLYKIMEETELLDQLFFGFLINDYQSLLLIDKIIHHTLVGRVRSNWRCMMKKFEESHKPTLHFMPEPKASDMMRIRKTQKGDTQLVFPITFKVTHRIKQQTVYNLCYSHKALRKNKAQSYICNCQFFVNGRENRQIWIYQEQEKLGTESFPLSYSTDTPPIMPRDTLTLNIPFFISGHQVFDFKFYPLEVLPQVKPECQLENIHEWKEFKPEHASEFSETIEKVKQMFTIVSHQYSMVGNNERIELECSEGGKSMRVLGITFESCGSEMDVMVRLKKRGCYDESGWKIVMRKGDRVVVYLIKP